MEHELRRTHHGFTIRALDLLRVMMFTMLCRLPGLRDTQARVGHWLGTKNFSSIAAALARPWALGFVRRLIERLIEMSPEPGHDELLALDSMAVSLPSTRRHKCKRMNDKSVGGGVIWSFQINARPGVCPIRPLKIVDGAWNDAGQMPDVELIAHGPVYLMDRGFFGLKLIEKWLGQGVRFILRSKKLVGVQTLEQLSRPRRHGRIFILSDEKVRLGGPKAKGHPVVRMIRARIGAETILSLVTGEWDWSAERILDAYKQRWRIEEYHRFIKETVGLAHLYSFSQTGIMFLLHAATLMCMLLFMAEPNPSGQTISVLRRALKALRNALGISGFWRRNMVAVASGSKARKRSAKRQT